MPESEEIHSARDVAQALGVGAAMLRRYAQAYEQTSGEKVEIHPRDGRLFSQSQLDTLLIARAIVQRDSASVEAAISQALGSPEQALQLRVPSSTALDTQVLVDALRLSQEPILNKLRDIEIEIQALRTHDTELQQPQTTTTSPAAGENDTTHGPLVRLALWIEKKIYGKDKVR